MRSPEFELATPPEQENSLPEYVHMYEISGQPAITEHSFDRYEKDKEQDEKIVECAENGSAALQNRLAFELSTYEEKSSMLMDALASPIISVRLTVFSAMSFIPEGLKEQIIEAGLKSDDMRVQSEAMDKISSAPSLDSIRYLRKMVTDLAYKYLSSDDIHEQRKSLVFIGNAEGTEKKNLRDIILAKVQAGLSDSDPAVRKIAAIMIFEVPLESRLSLIKKCLEDPNENVRVNALNNYTRVDAESLPDLVKLALKNTSKEVRMRAARLVSNIYDPSHSGYQLIPMIKQCLDDSNINVQMAVLHKIHDLEQEQVINIIDICSKKDPQVFRKSLNLLLGLPDAVNEPLFAKYIDMCHYSTRDSLVKILEQRVNRFGTLINKKISEMIRRDLQNPDIERQKSCIDLIPYAKTPEDREEFFNIAIKKGLIKDIIKSKLYRNSTANDETFSRSEFDKTGSETTIIGGELYENTIIRHIKPEAFLTWKELYENHELWKDYGFDYVPIEPIQSYRLNSEGLVDVYSGVLDLSFGDWNHLTETYEFDLMEQKAKILSLLENLKIIHGHEHDGNFCLRFFRDKDGNIELSKCPRIYMIDFDQAISPNPYELAALDSQVSRYI